jgi:hypothetical protein
VFRIRQSEQNTTLKSVPSITVAGLRFKNLSIILSGLGLYFIISFKLIRNIITKEINIKLIITIRVFVTFIVSKGYGCLVLLIYSITEIRLL